MMVKSETGHLAVLDRKRRSNQRIDGGALAAATTRWPLLALLFSTARRRKHPDVNWAV
jgi:hypothetical protein